MLTPASIENPSQKMVSRKTLSVIYVIIYGKNEHPNGKKIAFEKKKTTPNNNKPNIKIFLNHITLKQI